MARVGPVVSPASVLLARLLLVEAMTKSLTSRHHRGRRTENRTCSHSSIVWLSVAGCRCKTMPSQKYFLFWEVFSAVWLSFVSSGLSFRKPLSGAFWEGRSSAWSVGIGFWSISSSGGRWAAVMSMRMWLLLLVQYWRVWSAGGRVGNKEDIRGLCANVENAKTLIIFYCVSSPFATDSVERPCM